MNKQLQTDIEIGKRLRDFRVIAGISQTELGEPLGVSFQQIQKYEAGKNRISASALIVLCKKLGITPNDMIGAYFEDEGEPGITVGVLAGRVRSLESRLSEIKRLAA